MRSIEDESSGGRICSKRPRVLEFCCLKNMVDIGKEEGRKEGKRLRLVKVKLSLIRNTKKAMSKAYIREMAAEADPRHKSLDDIFNSQT